MNELALFAGAGGGILEGILLGWRTICAVEIEPYCREVLLRRQRDGVLPVFPIWDDVRTFDGRAWRGLVDILTAGFPCQPFSNAGKLRGADDERNMWPETIRCIRDVGPEWCLLENVPGLLIHGYFGQILGDLAEAGYDAAWDIVSAGEVGAPHVRQRIWIVAHNHANGCLQLDALSGMRKGPDTDDDIAIRDHWNFPTSGCNCGAGILGRALARSHPWRSGDPADLQASDESFVGRVADGVADRVDRLRAIGNGQVPLVAAVAWERLTRSLIESRNPSDTRKNCT